MKPKYTKKQIAEAIAYWERQLKAGNYRGIEESTEQDIPSITVPSDTDKIDMDRFQNEIDKIFDGDMYEYFVPDKYDRMEEQTAIDDCDVYMVNHQSTISRTYFWDLAFEDLFDVYGPGQAVNAQELKDFFETACSKLAENAWNEYRPSEDELIGRAGENRNCRRK